MEEAKTVKAISETSISRETEKINQQFHELLDKANKENPQPADVFLPSIILSLWKRILGMGALAEHNALENILGNRGQGSLECWKLRLEAMRSDLGSADSPLLEQLLIQQVTLCWLNLNSVEFKHSNVMKQSIT